MWTIQGIENIENWTLPAKRAARDFLKDHVVSRINSDTSAKDRIRAALLITEYDACIAELEATCKSARAIASPINK